MIPIIIAIAGAILTIAGAVVQYNEKETAKKTAEDAKSEAKAFNTKLIESQEKLVAQQNKANEAADLANKEIIKLNHELNQKTSTLLDQSESVRREQEETINFIQGSESPELSFFGTDHGMFAPVLYNATNYPIYDVNVSIDDFDKILECKTDERDGIVYINDACLTKFSTSQGPYFISPGARQILTHTIRESEKLIHLRIECISRIKITTYLCILKPLKNEISFCIRVYQVVDQKNKLIRQINKNLDVRDEDYWNKHFYANKIIDIGPL